jgi:hypothetical protein
MQDRERGEKREALKVEEKNGQNAGIFNFL